MKYREQLFSWFGQGKAWGIAQTIDNMSWRLIVHSIIQGNRTKATHQLNLWISMMDYFNKDGWLHTGDLALEDAEGNITIKGRSKNMLLSASGQNIYPEEIEDKLNNLPYVAESIIVQQNDKLVGLVYPDFDEAFAHGLKNEDMERVMEENRVTLNEMLPAYSQISKMKIYPEEFEKTPKKSIKRFLYQEAKG